MKKIMKNIYYKSKEILDNCSKDNVSEYSAQCAYYTILSFIPFFVNILTLKKGRRQLSPLFSY